jgi:hypothetical protein
MTQQERVFILSGMTNHDESGRHFTARCPMDTLLTLEREGFIDIHRPIMPYGRGPHGPCRLDQWELELTWGAEQLLDGCPQWHDNS